NRTDRVFDVVPLAAAQLTLSGLTVQNGAAFAPAVPPANGGGILVRAGSGLSLGGVRVTNNIAAGSGAGVANLGFLNAVDTIIDQNRFINAILGTGISNTGTATLRNLTIVGNSGAGEGAGIYSTGGVLTVTNSTIAGNLASSGRGTGRGAEGGGIFGDGT